MVDNFHEIKLTIWGILSGIIAFYIPISLMIHVILITLILDTITAVLRDMSKLKRGCGILTRLRIIKSNKLRKTAIKLIFFTLIIMVVYAAEIAVFGVSLYITNFMAFLIIFSELTSIAENCDIMAGTNKFSSIIDTVRKLFEKKVSDVIDRDEEK